MKLLKNFIEKQKNKSLFSKITDILFIFLIIGLLIPQTRTPIMVFVKKLTNFSPSVSLDDHFGTLSNKDFQWKFLDSGHQEKQLLNFRDKPILINFWATWCPPCIAEMPSFQKLQNDYGKKVHFIFISNEDQTTTYQFLQEKEWYFKSYRPISPVPEILQSNSLPTTFIINKDGKIIVKETGNKNWNGDSVRTLLDQLLRE